MQEEADEVGRPSGSWQESYLHRRSTRRPAEATPSVEHISQSNYCVLWKDRGQGGKRKGREADWAVELVRGTCSGLHKDKGNTEEGQTPGTSNTQGLAE